MINPFSLDGITDDSEPIALCNIASRTVPGEDITDDLLGAYEKGFKRINDFLKERLNTNKVGFFEAQTKRRFQASENYNSLRRMEKLKASQSIVNFLDGF